MNTQDFIKNGLIDKTEYADFENKKIELRSKTIGKILKFLRKKTNLKQKTVAEMVGIAQQTYGGYESGRHEPSIEIMIRLADIYEVSMDFITGRNYGTEQYTLEEKEFIANLENSYAYYKMIDEIIEKFDNLKP